MDPIPQADAAIVTPSPAPVVPPAPPANNPTKQNESTVGSVEADLGKLTAAELDRLSGLVSSKIPRDSKGKALSLPVATEPAPAPKVEETAPADPVPDPETPPVDPEPDATPVETDPVPTDPAPADPAPPVELDPDEPETTGKQPQQRLRATNPVDTMALTLYRQANAAGKKMTLGEAETEAKRILGVTAPTETAPVKSVEAAQAELTALREQRKAARTAFDTDAEEAAEIAIETKLEEIRDLKQDMIARQQAQVHQVQSALQKSTARALELYPELEIKDGKTPHPIVAIKDRIWAEHVANGDPIVNQPNYPLLLAQMAAGEAHLTPKPARSTTPTKPTTPRSVQPAKPVAPIGAAASRTTQPGTGQTAAAVVDSLDSRGLTQLTNQIAKLAKR